MPEENLTLCWGDTFRGLFVHSLLGEGAMGRTYLASHPALQIPLVIKLFKSNNGTDLLREARLAARITSPNIVGVIDAGEENGVQFIIQRYVDGIDLDELSDFTRRANRSLPLAVVCRIIIDVAHGLHLTHQAGVIHRDVKPANLFLCGDGTAQVGDFGIATDARRHSAERIAGTPAFIAPEQWLNNQTGRGTDIYALGVTAHLLATGRLPFAAQNLAELQHAHLTKIYQPPSAPSPLAAYFYAVIERALQKEPSARYTTAEDLADTLKVVAQARPPLLMLDDDTAHIGPVTVRLKCGDLVTNGCHVIVNAANVALAMNLGVAAALKKAGGPEIETAALAQAPACMGDVVWTSAGNLKAHRIAHAVAAFNGAVCLQRCVLRVLLGAELLSASSVAFPALGTGVGQVPMELAAKLMLEAICTFATLEPRTTRYIEIVLRDEAHLICWREIMASMAQGREAGPPDFAAISLANTAYLPTEQNVPRETAPTELYEGSSTANSTPSAALQETLTDGE